MKVNGPAHLHARLMIVSRPIGLVSFGLDWSAYRESELSITQKSLDRISPDTSLEELHVHLHSGHLADAFIQSDSQ